MQADEDETGVVYLKEQRDAGGAADIGWNRSEEASVWELGG
ncbi:hypothetical protein ANO14919_128760 [Xylariales sp. No.14919]|nr:hypothetical protein ANO14919_128760 [Xylariales sp. No.14919]